MQIQKSFEAGPKEGILYVIGTPIGNLQDLSPRARDCMAEVDLIAAEDTRHTRKLLSHFQFSTPLTSYHEHNQHTKGKDLIEKLKSGNSIALVSDAGLPGISDPGELLIKQAIESGISVVPIPGPNAALTALVASGIPPQPFLFIGFLPREKSERRKALEHWKQVTVTLICYEAPHRLLHLLKDALHIWGNRQVAIARELTKKHEEWLRGSLEECYEYIKEHGARGEYVLVFAGAEENEIMDQGENDWWTKLSILEHVEHYLAKGESKKDAIQLTAKDRGIPKREVYQLYHNH